MFQHFGRLASDLLCTVSLIGIWPRFIEPNLLRITHLKLAWPLRKRIRLVQISDLHFKPRISNRFLNKIINRIDQLSPDIIVITGDFLCYGRWQALDQMRNFFKVLQAPLGVYAILGNHDYENGLTINAEGDYDTLAAAPSTFLKGLKRLISAPPLSRKATPEAKQAIPHPHLLEFLRSTSVQLLNNQTIQIDSLFNLTGCGEYMGGHLRPDQAFQGYEERLPGIVLVHNPDAFSELKSYPGDLVLAGHTHGRQINLPWLRKRFCRMENPRYAQGLFYEDKKTFYVSRGLGAVVPLRFNAIPEIVSVTLEKQL